MNVAPMTHHIISCYILTFQGSENDDSRDGRNEMNFNVGMLNTWKSWMKLMLPVTLSDGSSSWWYTNIYIYTYIHIPCWWYILHVCHMLFFECFLKIDWLIRFLIFWAHPLVRLVGRYQIPLVRGLQKPMIGRWDEFIPPFFWVLIDPGTSLSSVYLMQFGVCFLVPKTHQRPWEALKCFLGTHSCHTHISLG